MVLDPDVLLLDEPLGALDLKLREAMKIELKLLQHQFDTTFVYITHDQSEALVMSDNVAIMNEGKFVQIGTPQELYHNPSAAFVAGFVGDTNRWAGKVTSGRRRHRRSRNRRRADHARIHPRRHQPGRRKTVRRLRAAGIHHATRPVAPRHGCRHGHNLIDGKVDSILFNGANSRVLVRSALAN
jgi:spermidine/putrescine transport system ATP-binding protein